ncbi:hypothetical protein JCM10450v2_007685 [Rhodotorula kratochvilovae]
MLAVGAAVLLGWWTIARLLHLSYEAPTPCNAFEKPGRLLVNLSSPLHTHWRPLAESACPPLPDYLPALWAQAHGEDSSLPEHPELPHSEELQLVAADQLPPSPPNARPPHNPTNALAFLRPHRRHPPSILLLGDSTDRDALAHFCTLFQQNLTTVPLPGAPSLSSDPRLDAFLTASDPALDERAQREVIHRCEIPRASSGNAAPALRVLSAFHCGMDDVGGLAEGEEGAVTAVFEERVDELLVPALETLGGADKVDVVLVHSGILDLALFDAQSAKARRRSSLPLTPEQLERLQKRMRTSLAHAGNAGNGEELGCERRVHQLRHLQRELARQERLPTSDFGRLIEGYQTLQTGGRLDLLPAGVVYAQGILHELRLALESRRSWRRGWLWDL